MRKELPFAGNSVFLPEDQRDEVMRLSALNYSARDIAVYLGFEADEIILFEKDAATPYTDIWLFMRKGKLMSQAKPEMKLQELAEDGNITAAQELVKIMRQKNFEEILKQLDEDEL